MTGLLELAARSSVLSIYKAGARYGVRMGFREGYKRGRVKSSKRYVGLNPDVFGPYVSLYWDVHKFAVKVNLVSYNKYNPLGPSYRGTNLSRGCLYKLGERAVILHRSVLSLCEDGWASVAPVILRTLMECVMHSILIVKKDSEYMAFRYAANEYLNDLIATSTADDSLKKHCREEIRKMLGWLNPEDRRRAEEYIEQFEKRTEPKIYWYRPEYRSTNEILQLCSKPSQQQDLFRIFSMSTHSTIVGANIFKDQPDKIDINPRADRRGTIMALMGTSTLLLEVSDIRNQFERLGLEDEACELRKRKAGLRDHFEVFGKPIRAQKAP